MAKETVQIELTRKDIIALVAKAYNLDEQTAKLRVSYYPSNPRESEHLSITVSGQKRIEKMP